MPRPTREVLAVAAVTGFLVFVAFNLQAGWVYAIDALLMGLIIGGFFSTAWAVRGITVRREMPQEAFEGDRISVSLMIRSSRWPRPFVEVVDAVPGLVPHHAALSWVMERQDISIVYHSEVLRRGVHSAGSVQVRSAGLTGFFVASRQIAAPSVLVAFPRYHALARFPLGDDAPEGSVTAPHRARTGLEFYGVREYRPGDTLRRVHWRTTARAGSLVVREFEREATETVTLLLDTRAEVHASHGGPAAFEDLVRAAASIAHFLTSGGRRVRLLFARQTAPTVIEGGWLDALHALARIQPVGTKAPAALLSTDDLGISIENRARVVLLTSDPGAIAPALAVGSVAVIVYSDRTSYHIGPGDNSNRLVPHGLGSVPSCILRHGEDIGLCLESCA